MTESDGDPGRIPEPFGTTRRPTKAIGGFPIRSLMIGYAIAKLRGSSMNFEQAKLPVLRG